jgi:predicted RNA-binding protein YlxR (DUF448 family)
MRTGPERKCLATGEVCPKSELIRFVVGPDTQVVPDILSKLPGRGFYVKANKAAIAKAIDKNLFSRGAKQPVRIPANLAVTLEQALARRLIDLISLARKAGDAVAGYEKVKDWLAKDHARVLIQATDGSERGKSKLRPPEGAESFVEVLTASELGLAFGRESVIHGALKAGGLTKRVVEEAQKLSGLRMKDGGNGHLKG